MFGLLFVVLIDNAHIIKLVLQLIVADMLMLIFTKRVMSNNRQQHVPFSLSQAQFVVSAILSHFLLRLRAQHQTRKSSSSRTMLLQWDSLKWVTPLSILWTLGFCLFNASASYMSPAHVNLIRCGEPLATTIVGFLLFGSRYSMKSLMTLVPIIGGVVLASSRTSSSSSALLSTMGVVTACISNVCFCFRPFLVKRLKAKSSTSSLDNLQLFFHVTVVASIIMSVVVVLVEGNRMVGLVRENPWALIDVVASSICFFQYQYTQLRIMSSLSPLAFSILTPVVKALMIIGCSWYFGDPFRILSCIGVLTTTFGGYLFSSISKKSQGTTTTSRTLPTHQKL